MRVEHMGLTASTSCCNSSGRPKREAGAKYEVAW